jgi:hypothetical protein
MTVVYNSTDASAPTLTGQVGSLVALLDACLVNGYGAKAAAGWTKPFTGTNGACFKQGTSVVTPGTQRYLKVDDNGPGAATAKEARASGFEAMTAFGTGTGQFPTTTQLAAGIIPRKSTTADGTARAWTVFADARTVYVYVLTGDTAGAYFGFCFGDIYSAMATDAYKQIIIGPVVENSASAVTGLSFAALASSTAVVGHYMPRSYTQLGTSIQVKKGGDGFVNGLGVNNANALVGPINVYNGPDSSLYTADVRVGENPSGQILHIRGRLRGFRHQLHPIASLADGDTFDGVGEMDGRSFIILKQSGSGTSVGCFCMETTAWEESV